MKRRDFCKATLVGGAVAAIGPLPLTALAEETKPASGSDIAALKLSGEPTTLPAAAVKALAGNLHGRLITAADADYDQSRRLWNKMIDRRPALIARCSGAADVAHAVSFARERDLLVAVRGGGHSFPGYSMCNGGLVIDLSGLRGVSVDPVARSARVAGGAWGSDLDWEAQQYGLATTMGTVSNTGVAGLTLGGGYGWIGRSFGLACDNVLSVDLVTADARLLHASAKENPDLYWGVRGGGGNFGVVTAFEYRLHPVGPQVLAGNLIYAPAQQRAALEYYAEYATRAPRELDVEISWGAGDGDDAAFTIGVCYLGDPATGEKVLQPLRAATRPVQDTVRMMSYVDVQRQFDGPPLSSHNSYLKGGYVAAFTPAFIDALVNEVKTDAVVGVEIVHCGGAYADVDVAATPIAHRKELFQVLVAAVWTDPADDARNRARTHTEWDKVSRFTNGFYVNLNAAEQKAVNDNYGANFARLEALKKRYDPANLFRLNANVAPSA